MTIAYLNQEYIELAQAKISVLDRGFLFGDGVYEVIPVYHGKIVGLTEHLARLNQSLANINMTPVLTKTEWQAIFTHLAAKNFPNDQDNFSYYLQVTRGVAPIRNHAIPETVHPTIFVTTFPITQAVKTQGITVCTIEDQRWQGCKTKAITLLPNVLAKSYALAQGYHDCIFITKSLKYNKPEIGDCMALEGSSSNFFLVKNGQIITPPLSENILPGVTRKLILEILQKLKLNYHEQIVTVNQLYQADEVWLSSSIQEITPVISIDKKPIGNGQPGPIWQQVYQHYQCYKTSN